MTFDTTAAAAATGAPRTYRTLSTEGYQAVRQWLLANCRGARNHPPDYWFGYAQNVLDKTPAGEPLLVELPARDCISGEPSTLELLPQHISVEAA